MLNYRTILVLALSALTAGQNTIWAIPKGDKQVLITPVATGLVAPVRLTHAGDSRLFVVDQIGQIRIIDHTGLRPTPFLDLSSKMVTLRPRYDERGLLGLAFHPNFAQNGKFYVYYSAPGAPTGWDHHSVISEYRVSPTDPNMADPNSERILLTIDQPQSNHNGGHLAFGPDGYLYIATGDGGGANDEGIGHTPQIGNGQDTTNLLGKILRIDVDNQQPGQEYAIPVDNPFYGSSTDRPEIYAWGFRNPYSFSFDRGGSRQLFLGDVGQNRVEEVNIVVKGGNYGWKAKEGTLTFDPNLPQTGYIDPIAEYYHPDGSAVIGGFVYRGSDIPYLEGTYVFGDLSKLPLSTAAARLFYLREVTPGRFEVVEFQVGPGDEGLGQVYLKGIGEDARGELYLLVSSVLGPSGNGGEVWRLSPVPEPGSFTALALLLSASSLAIGVKRKKKR
jgi:glucose/arabinose dehydrogenase